MRLGHHGPHIGMDAAVDVAVPFTRRAFGVSELVGKFTELTNATPKVPGYRERQARILWNRIAAGALSAEAEAAVRRDYAKEFKRLGFTR